MNNKIKEILDKLKDNDWYEELDLTGTKWIELKQEETNQLLDYITNLQEKVNQYENPDDMTLFYMWLDEKAKDKIKQLQEENKEIYETQKEYGCIILDTCDFIEQRIRKDGFLNLNECETRDLLNILQGEDEE